MWWLVCLVGAAWSSQAVPQGDNTCQGVIKHPVKVRVNVTEPVTYRTYTWCLRVPPRCSNYVIQMKERVKVQTEMHNRTITVCCRGFVEMESKCVPACPPHTECPNMHCNRTNHCYCSPGYNGIFCNDPCPKGVWGADCKKECDCPAGFTCHHLTGDCMLDDKPSVRTTVRRASELPLVHTTVHGLDSTPTLPTVPTPVPQTTVPPTSPTLPVPTTVPKPARTNTPSTVFSFTPTTIASTAESTAFTTERTTIPSTKVIFPIISNTVSTERTTTPKENMFPTSSTSIQTETTTPSTTPKAIAFPTPSTLVTTERTTPSTTPEANIFLTPSTPVPNEIMTIPSTTPKLNIPTTSTSTPVLTERTTVPSTKLDTFPTISTSSAATTEKTVLTSTPTRINLFPAIISTSAPESTVTSTETTESTDAIYSTRTHPHEAVTKSPISSITVQTVTTSGYTTPTTSPTHPFTFSTVHEFDDATVPQLVTVTDSIKTENPFETDSPASSPMNTAHPTASHQSTFREIYEPIPSTLDFKVTSSSISVSYSTKPTTIIEAESVNSPVSSTEPTPLYRSEQSTVASSYPETPEDVPPGMIFSSNTETETFPSMYSTKGLTENVFKLLNSEKTDSTTREVIYHTLSKDLTSTVLPESSTFPLHLTRQPDPQKSSVSQQSLSTEQVPEPKFFSPISTASLAPTSIPTLWNNFDSTQKITTLDNLEQIIDQKKHSTLTPSSDTHDISPSSAPWFPEVGILRMNEDKRSTAVPSFITSSESSESEEKISDPIIKPSNASVPTSADTRAPEMSSSVTFLPDHKFSSLKENSSPVTTVQTKATSSPVSRLVPGGYEHFTVNFGQVKPVSSTPVTKISHPLPFSVKPVEQVSTSTELPSPEEQLEKIRVQDKSMEEPSNYLPTVPSSSRTTSLWEFLESSRLKKEQAQSVFSYASSEPPSEDFLNLTVILNSISDFTAYKESGKDSEKINRGSFKLKYTDIPPYRPQLIHNEVPRSKVETEFQNFTSNNTGKDSPVVTSMDLKLTNTELDEASKVHNLLQTSSVYLSELSTEPMTFKTEIHTESTSEVLSNTSLSESTLVERNTETSVLTESVSTDSVSKKPFRRKDGEISDLSYNMSEPMASREEAPVSLTSQLLVFGGLVLLAVSVLCGAAVLWLSCKSKKEVEEDHPVAETILAFQSANESFVYSVPRSPVSPEIFFCPTFTSIHADKINKELQEISAQIKSPVEPVYAEIPF